MFLTLLLMLTTLQQDAASFTKLRYATVLVRDYDEALKWYTETLGFAKLEDQKFGPDRWIVVVPQGQREVGIVLAKPRSAADAHTGTDYSDRVGKETNWVFQATDCDALYKSLSARGVHFLQPAKRQPWGTVQAIFEDLYGNVFVVESPAKK